MKLSFLCSIVLFMPFLVFFCAKYLLPIFKKKSLIVLYSTLALALFFLGILLGFFYISPLVVNFMFQMAEPSIAFSLNASSFFNTIFMLCVMFGLVFEIPIVIFALLQTRVISLEKIRKFRKIYIVLSFIVGAVITPPDVISQTIVALLLIALLEITLVIFSIFGKKNAEV
jgi:sec-independent protein translocase protein TatC